MLKRIPVVIFLPFTLLACAEAETGPAEASNLARAASEAANDSTRPYSEIFECAAQMRASEQLTDQVARAKTGMEQSQLTLEMVVRGGRANVLRANAVEAGRALDHPANAVEGAITGRAAAIRSARASAPLEDYARRIGGIADRCYEHLA